MDVHVNQKKAAYFQRSGGVPNPVLPSPGDANYNSKAARAYGQAANALQDHGVAAQFMGFDDTIALFRATHQRLHWLFGEIDYDLGCRYHGQGGISTTWAAAYSTWMREKVLCFVFWILAS